MEGVELSKPKLGIWIVTLNRQIHKKEFLYIARYADEKTRNDIRPYKSLNEAFRYCLAHILPPLVMRNRDQSRSKSQWFYAKSSSGKEYINSPSQNKVLGYSTGWAESVVGIASAFGRKSQVVNIGMDIMRLSKHRSTTIEEHVAKFLDKLTSAEIIALHPNAKDEVVLRRLCILITIKRAYVKALGKVDDFDYRRIDCDFPNETIKVDGNPLTGWEFRLFKANLGVVRNDVLHEEFYQCTTAMYCPGMETTTFVWAENQESMSNWVQFISIDTIIDSLQPRPASSETTSTPSTVPSPP